MTTLILYHCVIVFFFRPRMLSSSVEGHIASKSPAKLHHTFGDLPSSHISQISLPSQHFCRTLQPCQTYSRLAA